MHGVKGITGGLSHRSHKLCHLCPPVPGLGEREGCLLLGPACPTHTRTPASFMLCPTSTPQMPTNAWCFQSLVIPKLGASANHGSEKGGPGPPALLGSVEQSRASLSTQRQHPWGLRQSVTAGREGPPGGGGRGTGAHTLALISLRTMPGRGGGGGSPTTRGTHLALARQPRLQEVSSFGRQFLGLPTLTLCEKQKTTNCCSSASLSAVAREPGRFQLSLTFPPPKPLPAAADAPAAPPQGGCLLPAAGEPRACSQRPFLSEVRCSHADRTLGDGVSLTASLHTYPVFDMRRK